MIDAELIKRKIKLINRDLKELDRLGNLNFDQFQAKKEYEVLAERYLERIIGRMIDINYHILSNKNIIPSDYFSSFIEMGEQNYLPLELSQSLANSAGLRNRLTHEYDEIDENQIYKAIGRALKEVPQFLKYILQILDKESNQKRLF